MKSWIVRFTGAISPVAMIGIYDKRRVYHSVHERGAELLTRPCKNV